MSALSVSEKGLPDLLENIREDIRKKVLQTSGIDEMAVLHLATFAKNDEYIEDLINNSVRFLLINKSDIWGRNALHIATRFGYKGITSKLLGAGALLDREDEFGKTPITYCLKLEPAMDRDGLIADIANVAKKRIYRDKDGKSILHLAIEFSDDVIVKTLIPISAQDVGDDMGRIPLQAAIVSGREDVAMSLLTSPEPATGSEDVSGITTLMHVYRKGFQRVISRLRYLWQDQESMDKELRKTDNGGRTVLYHTFPSTFHPCARCC